MKIIYSFFALAISTTFFIMGCSKNNSAPVGSPSITTTPASNITQTTAQLGGDITADNGDSVTARGVIWGTTSNLTVTLGTKTINGTGIGSFTSSITGLTANTQYYAIAYATNINGTAYGNLDSFITINNNSNGCGIVTDIDGNTYNSVTIGTQCWIEKNLDVSHYQNGDTIPEVEDSLAWGNLTIGAWCYYENNTTIGAVYGKLYNWFAVNDPRGLAPSGWHVPSDSEWTILVNYLGGTVVAGGHMKEVGITHWLSPNTGADNSSGFTALPSASRDWGGGDAEFIDLGYVVCWWSSNYLSTTNASIFSVWYGGSNVGTGYDPDADGYSVRCVKN